MFNINLKEGNNYSYDITNISESITFTISSNSAAAGIDYKLSSGVTEVSSSGNSKTYNYDGDSLTISAINDFIYDPASKNFTLTFAEDYFGDGEQTYNYTIEDIAPVVSINSHSTTIYETPEDYEIPENPDEESEVIGHIDLELSNEVTNAPGVIVNYEIDSDSEGIQGVDFYSSQVDISTVDGELPTNSIFVAAGEDTARIYLTALPDAEIEGSENIRVNLLPDYNQALVLDGVDDYVDISNEFYFDRVTDEITVEAWIKVDSFDTAWQSIVTKGESSWALQRHEESNNLNFTIDGLGSVTSSSEVNDGEWHHVAGVYNGSEIAIYIDGVEEDSLTASGSIPVNDFNVAIGENTEATGRYFNGEIDEVRVWDKGRSETEIQNNLYANVVGNEDNLVGYWSFNEATVTGTNIADVTFRDNNAFEIAGEDSYLVLDGDDEQNFADFDFGNNDFTTELWFKTDSETGTLIGSDDGDEQGDFWQVVLYEGKVLFDFDTGNGNSEAVSSQEIFNDGEWHHVAAVRDGTTGYLYLDGVRIDGSVGGNNGNSSLDTEEDAFIGDFPLGINDSFYENQDFGNQDSEYFIGDIDEVRVWNDRRSATEIADNLYTSLTGDEDNLIAYYNFDDGTATDLSEYDRDTTINNATSVSNNNDGTLINSDVDAFTDSLASDPFSVGDATYGIATSQTVDISIADSDGYRAGIAIANRYGEEVADTNEILLDNGTAYFTLKLTSQPTAAVTVDFGSLGSYEFTVDNWDEVAEFNLDLASDLSFSVSSEDANYNFNETIYVTNSSDEVKLKVTEGGTELDETILPTVGINTVTDAGVAGEVTVEVSNSESNVEIPFTVAANTITDVSSDALQNLISLNTAADFDGEDDYIAIANSTDLDLSGSVTMEAFVKVDSFDRPWQTIISKGDGWQLSRSNDSDSLYFGYGDTLGVMGSSDIADGEWHHVAGVYDGTQVAVYVDGELEATETVAVNYVANSNNLQIGGNEATSDRNFSGQIDEVRLWNVSRTAEEIKTGAVQSLAGTETGLLGYWTFDDSTANDFSGNDYNGTFNNGLASDGNNFVESYFHRGTLSTRDTATIEVAAINESNSDRNVEVTLQSGDDYVLDLNNDTANLAIEYEASGISLGETVTVGDFTLEGTESLLDLELTLLEEEADSNYLATFDLALGEEITGDEVVTVTFDDGENTSLTFTADNWQNSQRFTVDGDLAYNLNITSTDANSTFNTDIALNLEASELDTPFNEGEAAISTSESGETGEFTVSLASQPTADVAIALAIEGNDTLEGTFADGTNSQSLIFTSENWDTPQTITVEGVDDSQFDGNTSYSIDISATSNDDDYNGLSSQLKVTNQDNETEVDRDVTPSDISESSVDIYAGISFVSGEVAEGSTAAFEINLINNAGEATSFTNDTVVNYQIQGGTATSDRDFAPITEQVTIPAGESSVTVDLETYQDEIDEDAETIELNLVSSGIDVEVIEAYDVNAGTIALQLDSSDLQSSLDLTTGYELSFTNGATIIVNENVTLSDTDATIVSVTLDSGDEIAVGETSRIYQGDYQLNNDIAVISDTLTITDDDTADVLITDSLNSSNAIASLITAEADAGTSNFFVQLTSQPTDNVLIYFGSTDIEEGTLSDSNETFQDTVKLLFTPANWDTPQEVKLNSVNDREADGDVSYQILSHVISDDPKYNEDTIALAVANNFDADSDNTIDLQIDDLTINSAELLAGTKLTFANGMTMTVRDTVTLSNESATTVSVSNVRSANRLSVDATAKIDNDNDITTDDVTLIVTEEYSVDRDDNATVSLQLDSSSNVDSLELPSRKKLTFDNGAVVTLEEAVTLTNEPTSVRVILDENVIKIDITQINRDVTAQVAIDSSDADSELVEVIVSSDYDSLSGLINLTINDTTLESLTLEAGTVISFSNGTKLTVANNTEIINNDAIFVPVTPIEPQINTVQTNYTETSALDLDVTNTDDDTAGVTVLSSDTSTIEGFSNNFFTVSLDSQPTEEVSITFTPNNDDVRLASEFDGESHTITFDADNWSIPQNVRVTAVDDFEVEYDHSSNIAIAVTSEDSNYDAIAPSTDNVEVFITDNDLPSVSIEAVASADEAGSPGYFVITLDEAAPNGFDGTGIEINYIVDTTSSTADLNDGDSETDDLQPITGTVRIAPGETQSQVIAFPIDDFKVEAVPLEVVTGLSNGEVELAIAIEDLNDTLLETLSNSGLTIAAGTELTFASTDNNGEVTYTTATVNNAVDLGITAGSADSQTVSVAIDDSETILAGDTTNVPEETLVVNLIEGSEYLVSSDAASATLSINDNDKPGVRIIEPGDRTVVTEGDSSTYYVSLLSQPESDVEITVNTVNTEAQLTIQAIDATNSTVDLIIDPSNEVSSLLLSAGNNLVFGNEEYLVVDNSESQSGYIISNEDTATTVTLNKVDNLASDQTLSYSYSELAVGDSTDEEPNKDTLTFTAENWYELQPVTVTGIDDNVVEEGNFHTSDLTYNVDSSDSNYQDFAVAPQTIEIIDRTFNKENVTASLTEGFLGLQDAIDSVTLPIVGDLSSVSPDFLEDFLENLIAEVKATEEVTAETLTEAFNNAFDITIDESGFDSDLFGIDIEITDLAEDNIEFLLNIGGEFGESFPLNSDLGLSALGISLETNGSLNANFEYGIDLAFGINQDDGFYLNIEDTSLALGAELALSETDDSDDFGITGRLGFLQLDVEDNIGDFDENGDELVNGGFDEEGNEDPGTNISAEFTTTFQNINDTNGNETQLTLAELNAARDGNLSDLIQYGFSGDAALDLSVATSFEGDTSFPSFNFDLYSELPLFNYDNADDEEDISGATVSLNESISRSSLDTTKATGIKVNITRDSDDGDSSTITRLNKGTELTFKNGNTEQVRVIVDRNYTFDADDLDTEQEIEVTLAKSDRNTVNTISADAEAQLVSGDFSLEFNNIELDLGEFITEMMSPIIDFANDLVEPFEPIIEVLQTEVEVIDSLGLAGEFDLNGDDEVSLIEVASSLATAFASSDSKVDYAKFFDAVSGIIDLVDTVNQLEAELEEDDATLAIEFGNYILESFNAADDNQDIDNYDTETGDTSSLNNDTKAQTSTKGSTISGFFNKLDDLGISIPIIEDPFTAIGLLLGQDVDLVTYDVPELDIEFSIEQEFPIFGSISGLLEGGFSIYSDLVLGYDTYGINQWAENDFEPAESYQILDGFYLSDLDPDTGEDVDELTLGATIAAGLEASAVVASASVKGGITGTAGLDIVDDGEYTGESDGRLRGSEVASDITSIFSLSGSLEAFLEATVRVGVDLGLFEVMKTVWSEEIFITLFEFELSSNGGTVSQAYLEESTVFFDSNLNGIYEEGEPITTTNPDGTFNLDIPLLFFDTNDNGEIDPEEGRLVAIGGTDITSEVAFETPLFAPYGSTMVTPLTTLKQVLIEAGYDSETAETEIETALNLPDVDLENFDPIAAIADGDTTGEEIYEAHVTLQTAFVQATEFSEEVANNFDDSIPLDEAVIEEIALNLVEADPDEPLADIVVEVLNENIPDTDDATITAFGDNLGDSIDYVESAFNDAAGATTLVEDVAPVKQVVQEEVAETQSELASGDITSEAATSEVDSIIETAETTDNSDNPPVVSNAIADLTLAENADSQTINLNNVFRDADGDEIIITIDDNTNDDLVTATLSGKNLTLDLIEDKSGTADISIAATANSKTVVDTFTLTVTEDTAALISVTDSSGDADDASILFGTPLSQFRNSFSDSDLVRPSYPDSEQYIDITNTGDDTLTISDLAINASGVTADIPDDDILLNPNASQRIQLTYTPSAANEDFNLEDGLVITSNAANNSQLSVNLAGKSTFDSDINYDGIVSFGDLGSLNANWGLENTDTNWDGTADINGDGIISFGDLGTLNNQWNQELTSI